MKIICVLLNRGWIRLEIKTEDREQFNKILGLLKQNVHVLQYDKRYNRHLTSIYEFDRLELLCKQYAIELYVSKKLLKYRRRIKHKQKRLNEINGKLELKLWTKDKSCKILPYQKVAINKCFYARRYLLGDDMGVGKTITGIGIILKLFSIFSFNF